MNPDADALELMPGVAQPNTPQRDQQRDHRMAALAGTGAFLLLAIVGLYYVKWDPYYLKAFHAAATHTLGASMLSGKSASAPAPSFSAALSYAVAYYKAIWEALVLGLALAATVETLVPRDWLTRVLGSSTVRTSALGGLLALPGMMCTCCAAPLIVGLRRRGASEGAATAFFLGNPTLNPAVLIFLVFTLGWQWAALRLILGVALVIAAAALATALTRGAHMNATGATTGAPGATPAIQPPTAAQPGEGHGEEMEETGHWALRWLRAFARLALTLIPEYLIVVLALGAARAYLFPAGFILHGAAPVVILGLAVAGALFVIPTAGEIPIIQTLLAFGLSAGGAGALLLTLAPLSLPSLVMVSRVLPRRALLGLFGLTVLAGIVAGTLALALGL